MKTTTYTRSAQPARLSVMHWWGGTRLAVSSRRPRLPRNLVPHIVGPLPLGRVLSQLRRLAGALAGLLVDLDLGIQVAELTPCSA